jgi:hypothetical protein
VWKTQERTRGNIRRAGSLAVVHHAVVVVAVREPKHFGQAAKHGGAHGQHTLVGAQSIGGNPERRAQHNQAARHRDLQLRMVRVHLVVWGAAVPHTNGHQTQRLLEARHVHNAHSAAQQAGVHGRVLKQICVNCSLHSRLAVKNVHWGSGRAGCEARNVPEGARCRIYLPAQFWLA